MSVSVDLASALTTSGAPETAGGLSLTGALANDLVAGTVPGGSGAAAGDFALLLGLLAGPQGDAPAETETKTPADGSEPDTSEDESASPAAAAALAFSLLTPVAVVPEAAPPSSDGAITAPAAVDAPPEQAACRPAASSAGAARPEMFPEQLLAGLAATKPEVTEGDEVVTADSAEEPASVEAAPAAEAPAPVAAHGETLRPAAGRSHVPATPQPPATATATPAPDAAGKTAPSPAVVDQAHPATTVAVSPAAPVTEGRRAVENGASTHPSTERPAAATPEAAVEPTAGVQSDEGREPGRRGSDGGVVKAQVPALAHQTVDEAPTARRTSGGPDPSAPSPLPSPPSREPAPAPGPTAAPEPLRDVERFLRLQGLRPAPVADRGEMRLHVASDLGPIEVRVAVREDAVHANLYAVHDQARQALESQRSTLASALERSNLRLEGFTVGLGQHQQGAQGEPGRDGGLRPWSAPGTGHVTAVDDVVFEPAAPGRGLSLRA